MVDFIATIGSYNDDIGTYGSWACSKIELLEALYYRLKSLLIDNDVFVEFIEAPYIASLVDGERRLHHYYNISDYLDALYDFVLSYKESFKEV